MGVAVPYFQTNPKKFLGYGDCYPSLGKHDVHNYLEVEFLLKIMH
jgi:hypothetical protein